jgi:hypothetical protein
MQAAPAIALLPVVIAVIAVEGRSQPERADPTMVEHLLPAENSRLSPL